MIPRNATLTPRLRAEGGRYGHEPMAAGTLVRSHYRATWYGVVEAVGLRHDGIPFVIVRLVCTRDGRCYRKPKFTVLSPGWLTVVKSLPVRDGAELA